MWKGMEKASMWNLSKSNILLHKTNCHTKPRVKKKMNIKESPVCIICRKSYHSVKYMKKHMVNSHEASIEGGNIRYKINEGFIEELKNLKLSSDDPQSIES